MMSESKARKSTKRKPIEKEPTRKSARLLSRADPKSTIEKSGSVDQTKGKKAIKSKTQSRKPAKGSKDKKIEMTDADWENAKSVYDFTVRTIHGEELSLEKYKGFVLLIVNVASKCGLTSSNYTQLVALDEKYRDKGLRILGFPCNQFGKQEPGTADEICEFTKKRNVNFDLFEKIEVNGKNTHPLYKYLKRKQPGTLGDFIKWNFTKFIVDKEGQPVGRFPPTTTPESLIPEIEKYL